MREGVSTNPNGRREQKQKDGTGLCSYAIGSVPDLDIDLELLTPLGGVAPSFFCCRYRAAYGPLGRQKLTREPSAPGSAPW